jgi:hypothetical protein
VTDRHPIFLSYSRNDPDAATLLRNQLEAAGLAVFKDDVSLREGDQWLERLQRAIATCSGFVVLVGRDGVRRWIGAETQAALVRYFAPHDDAKRLPIFPILLGDTPLESLPAFLNLFQATRWDGTADLPETLITQIRELVPARPGSVRGAVHLRRQGRAPTLRPLARRRPGRRRLPALPDLDGTGRLSRSLR